MKRKPATKLTAAQLRWTCSPKVFGVKSSAELDATESVIGQDRALRALKLGIEVHSPGYNVFVAGLSGTGRMTAVRRILVGLADQCVDVPDKAYVHNFKDPSCPLLLQLPRGRIRQFSTALKEFAKHLPRSLRDLFDNHDYIAQRRKIEESTHEANRVAFAELTEKCRVAGLALIQVQQDSGVRPGLGIPIDKEVYPLELLPNLVTQGKLDQERADLLQEKAETLLAELDQAVIQARQSLRKLNQALEQFDKRQVRSVFLHELNEIRSAFPEQAVTPFLQELEAAILERVDLFREAEEEEAKPALGAFLKRLEVNCILDNSERLDTPVIAESNPTYSNLFGTVEQRVSPRGEIWTDHTRVRPGSLVAADGGYLILNVEDVLMEAGVWQTLKRVLKTGRLEIQPKASAFGIAPPLYKPEPIPLRVKVVLIGDGSIYAQLHTFDPDFQKTFKIRADFDSVMPRSEENIRKYGLFLRRMSHDEDILPFDAKAMACVAEEGARRTEQNDRLSTRFSEIADLAREAHHLAQREGRAQISENHVQQAVLAALHRDDLYDLKLRERIMDGTVLIDTDELAVGEVNGLTVYSSGKFSFGKPAKITATVAAGDQGIVNVEREVQLTGEIHDKGLLILSSFLRERFGQNHPLALSASLCFEQNYGGIDGDSASSTELYVLLSALANVSIQQGIAVTGSVNQKGFVQPIGGVNQKIEGFFEICAQRGLTGKQGVIVPAQNVADLMLRHDVVTAVEEDRFHLWSVSHVDQGIEILTGVKAGTMDANGDYPPDSINGKVAARLLRLAEIARDFKSGGDEKDDGGGGPSDEEAGAGGVAP